LAAQDEESISSMAKEEFSHAHEDVNFFGLCNQRLCLQRETGLPATGVIIGEAVDPMCDTFIKSSTDCGVRNMAAGGGACKVAECGHNEHFECAERNTHAGLKRNYPDWLMYEAR